MSLTDTRTDVMTVMTAIVSAWTDYPLLVEAPDRDVVDQTLQTNPYISVDIKMMGGEQKELGRKPLTEQRGQIVLMVTSKCGTGTVAANKLLDFVVPYFELKDLPLCVRTHTADVFGAKEIKGWRHSPILVNFFYHRFAG